MAIWLIGETDEEALTFAAMNTLDEINETFSISENQERMKAFMEAHPGVEIEVYDIPSGTGNMDDVLNNPEFTPDIVELTAYQAATMCADRLMDLGDWIGQENLWPGPYGDLISRATPAGDAVLLPIRVDPMVVWYDPAKFAELGLAEPEEGWTIIDYAEAARRLVAAGHAVYFPLELRDAESFIRSWGGKYTSPDGREVIGWLDSEETIEVYVRYAQLVPEEDNWDKLGTGELPALGIRQAAAMGSLIELKYAEYGVGPLPKAPDGERLNAARLSGFAVMRDSAQPVLAWELLKWLIGETDEEALTFAAMNTLDTIHGPFSTSENKSVAALREQARREIAVARPASFHPYLERPGYYDPMLLFPIRTREEYVTYRDRETARRELANLAKEWEEWMAASKNAVPMIPRG
jgi:multiple sugar transport system substrate-binding protein